MNLGCFSDPVNNTVDGWNPIPNHLGWCWNPLKPTINNGKSLPTSTGARIPSSTCEKKQDFWLPSTSSDKSQNEWTNQKAHFTGRTNRKHISRPLKSEFRFFVSIFCCLLLLFCLETQQSNKNGLIQLQHVLKSKTREWKEGFFKVRKSTILPRIMEVVSTGP